MPMLLPWTMHSRGMEGCRGPSTAPSHSLRSWLGFAQDDIGLRVGVLTVGRVWCELLLNRHDGFADVSGFVIVAGCEGLWDSLMFYLGGRWLLLRMRGSGLLLLRGFLRLGWML